MSTPGTMWVVFTLSIDRGGNQGVYSGGLLVYIGMELCGEYLINELINCHLNTSTR